MRRKKTIIDRDSTVAVELQKYDCNLIKDKRYTVFLNSAIESFRGAGYNMDAIIEGFKSIEINLTKKYILENTIGPMDEDKTIIAYYRTGYSVNSISKKFNRPFWEIQDLILADEDLRLNHHQEWVAKHKTARIQEAI